ncbi:hypothetical protein D3C72_2240860 [compost metagenome]
MREVFTDCPEIPLATLHATDAVGVVIAQAVHQRKLDTGALKHGLAVFFAKASLDKRGDYRAVWIAVAKVFQSVGFLGGVPEYHHVSGLFPSIE